MNEEITTVSIPLKLGKEQKTILREAIDQATWVAEKAAILLPGFQHREGEPVLSRRGPQKGQPKVYQSGKNEGNLIQMKSGVENINQSHLYDVVKTIRKKWGLPQHLGNEVCRDIVMRVHQSFKSSGSNWVSRLWRTAPWLLIYKYSLWSWIIPLFEAAVKELLGDEAWESRDFADGEKLSRAALDCGIISKNEIVEHIIQKKGKKIHRSNRPRFGSLKPHRQRHDRIPIPLHGAQCVKFTEDGVWVKVAGGMDLRIEKSKPRYRERIEEITGAYHSHWGEDILRYLNDGAKNGECRIVERGDKFSLHVPLRRKIVDQWDPGLPTYYVGIHQGIYRPFTIVVTDKSGSIIYKKVTRGQEAIHNWCVMDAKYAKSQAIAQDCHKWRPLTKGMTVPNHHIEAEGWRTRGGRLVRTLKAGQSAPKTWVHGTYYRRDLSKKEVRAKYSTAARFITRRTNQFHDFLHCKIKEVTSELENWPANFVVFFHDFTFVRDGHLKDNVLWGPDRDDLPKYVRRMGSLWPFLKTKEWLLSRLNRLGRVKSHPIPLDLACARCSSCGAVDGVHGNIGDEPFFEHYSHKFFCATCPKTLNADINAACNAAWLASQWDGKGDPAKWVREVGGGRPPSETARKQAHKPVKNTRLGGKPKATPPLAMSSGKRK